jgi:hypothetical protein
MTRITGAVEGALYNPFDTAEIAQNSDGSGTVTASDPVGYCIGNRGDTNINATQTDSGRKLTYQQAPGGEYGVVATGSTDVLTATTGSTTRPFYVGLRFSTAASFTATTQYIAAWGKGTTATDYLTIFKNAAGNEIRFYCGSTQTGGTMATSTTYAVFAKFINTATAQYFVDGLLNVSGSAGTNNTFTTISLCGVENLASVHNTDFTLHKALFTDLSVNATDIAAIQYVMANAGHV